MPAKRANPERETEGLGYCNFNTAELVERLTPMTIGASNSQVLSTKAAEVKSETIHCFRITGQHGI